MFPSGVFSTKDGAEQWIRRNALTGTLTQYPLDVGMYEFAIREGRFSPSKPDHTTSDFIGKFCGGGLDHFHYEQGCRNRSAKIVQAEINSAQSPIRLHHRTWPSALTRS